LKHPAGRRQTTMQTRAVEKYGIFIDPAAKCDTLSELKFWRSDLVGIDPLLVRCGGKFILLKKIFHRRCSPVYFLVA
jgi:hypothetical protein